MPDGLEAWKLDRRILIERQEISHSDSGEEQIGWEEVATVWASIQYESGYERFALQQNIGRTVVKFRIRWSNAVAELTNEHRITFDGRIWDITDFREVGRRVGIEIDAYASGEEPISGIPDGALMWGDTALSWGDDVMTWG